MLKRNQYKELPNKYGVYLFRDEHNEIIYIGKANDLKKRVSQYFNSKIDHSPKTKTLVSKIESIDFQITKSEIDALLLESTLINKYEPKYNIKIKRSFVYPYIEITRKIPIEVKLTKTIKKNNSLYFGPYPEGYSANKIVNILKEIFPFGKCLSPNSGKKCLNAQMGICIGNCYKKIKIDDYQEYIDKAKKFLNGNTKEVKNLLNNKIEFYSKNLQFENALNIKKYLELVEKIESTQKIVFKDSYHRNAFAFYEKNNFLTIVVLTIKFGRTINTETFTLQIFDIDLETSIRQFISQYYLYNQKPDFLIIDKKYINIANNLNINISKDNLKIQKSILSSLEKEAKDKFLFEKKILENKIKKYEIALNDLKEFISLKKANVIEMVDISSTQGANQVGAIVSFKNGVSDKSKYRKYLINTVEKMDDYASIREAVYRHFRRKLILKEEMPDLFLVDGKHQSKMALEEIEKLKIKGVTVIGIIKNKKHYTDSIILDNKKIISLDKKSKLWEFISQIQDEVHRFAINFHKKQREKNVLTTIFDKYNFLTKQDINNLFLEFETVRQIKIANEIDLIKIIGKEKTKKLIQSFQKDVNN